MARKVMTKQEWAGLATAALTDSASPTGWADASYNPVTEPVLNVGEAFFIIPTVNETWTRILSVSH
jgi:hypothetical protein